MKIMVLPMMQSEHSTPSQRAWEVTELLQKYPDEKQSNYLIGLVVAANYNSLEKEHKEKILEVLRMAQAFQELYREFEEKGREEGMDKGSEIAIMLTKGMSLDVVAKKQEVDISKVIAIKKKLDA